MYRFLLNGTELIGESFSSLQRETNIDRHIFSYVYNELLFTHKVQKFFNSPSQKEEAFNNALTKQIEKFYTQVNKTSKCWTWIHSKNSDGYGLLKVCVYGVMYGTHRFSYLINKGDIPVGLEVCHTCDNRNCVNPDHLWLGSHIDNVNDMNNKGRRPEFKGSKNPMSKLTELDVCNIRKRLDTRESLIKIAKDYGVSSTQIIYILRTENRGAIFENFLIRH